MAIIDSKCIQHLENISKTKVRGIVAFLKAGSILVTEKEGRSGPLCFAEGIETFRDLRLRHDIFVETYIMQHNLYMPAALKGKLIWQLDEDTCIRRLAAIEEWTKNITEFYAGYITRLSKNAIPGKTLKPRPSHALLMEEGNGYQLGEDNMTSSGPTMSIEDNPMIDQTSYWYEQGVLAWKQDYDKSVTEQMNKQRGAQQQTGDLMLYSSTSMSTNNKTTMFANQSMQAFGSKEDHSDFETAVDQVYRTYGAEKSRSNMQFESSVQPTGNNYSAPQNNLNNNQFVASSPDLRYPYQMPYYQPVSSGNSPPHRSSVIAGGNGGGENMQQNMIPIHSAYVHHSHSAKSTVFPLSSSPQQQQLLPYRVANPSPVTTTQHYRGGGGGGNSSYVMTQPEYDNTNMNYSPQYHHHHHQMRVQPAAGTITATQHQALLMQQGSTYGMHQSRGDGGMQYNQNQNNRFNAHPQQQQQPSSLQVSQYHPMHSTGYPAAVSSYSTAVPVPPLPLPTQQSSYPLPSRLTIPSNDWIATNNPRQAFSRSYTSSSSSLSTPTSYASTSSLAATTAAAATAMTPDHPSLLLMNGSSNYSFSSDSNSMKINTTTTSNNIAITGNWLLPIVQEDEECFMQQSKGYSLAPGGPSAASSYTSTSALTSLAANSNSSKYSSYYGGSNSTQSSPYVTVKKHIIQPPPPLPPSL